MCVEETTREREGFMKGQPFAVSCVLSEVLVAVGILESRGEEEMWGSLPFNLRVTYQLQERLASKVLISRA